MKQMKRRLGAMVLAMALALSLFPTSLIPAARAAEETGGVEAPALVTPTPEAVAADVPTTDPAAEPAPAFVVDSGLPTLHIDFLGDKDMWFPTLPTPTTHDVGLLDHATPAGDADWTKYASGDQYDDKVFWIGVGIDAVSAFKLAQQGGLYSAEIAFYYNAEFVEPVTSADIGSTFYDVVDYYNIDHYMGVGTPYNQWDSHYEIREAEVGLEPMGDPVTEEFAPDENWEMLYVSIENGGWGPNRFSTLPSATDTDTYYLMMIPFTLEDWDPDLKLCFRLARNASMFTIGSGDVGESLSVEANTLDGGFGAWERETRNPGHNLKEMFDFEGDLNIFTGKHERDDERFTATLHINDGGNASNGAKLYITNDNSPTPVVADDDGESITDLQAGISMTVELTGTASNFTPSVTVRQVGGATVAVPLTPDPTDPNKFTFIMPANSVNVNVKYVADSTSEDYTATLHVVDGGDALNTNKASMFDMTGAPTVTILPETPTIITNGSTVKVEIPVDGGGNPDYNTDYDITVTAVTNTGTDVSVSPVVVNREYTFTMPTADVDVTVTYTKAETYRVQLSVDAKQNGSPNNIAELYYYDGTGTQHAISANDRDGGDPWMEGARDGRKINGVIKVNQIPNPNYPGDLTAPPFIPEYQIKKVTLLYSDGTTAPVDLDWRAITSADIADDSYMGMPQGTAPNDYWEYLITMPDGADILMPRQDITIKVEFEKIGKFNVKLVLTGTDGKTGNTADIWGTDIVEGPPIKTTNMTGGPVIDNFDIYSGSTLRLDLSCAPGYKISKVEARHGSNGALEVATAGSIAAGYLEYRMPADDLKVTVTYELIDSNLYEATFQLTQNPSGAYNTASWMKENGTAITPTYPTVENYSGTELEGEITVAAGWHISTVEVISKTGKAGYPFEISGNGYNNGAGGKVTLTMEQPADDVFVKVYFVKGAPPETPKQTLSLSVQTTDGQDRPGNRAQLSVNGTAISGYVTTTSGYGVYSAPVGSVTMGDAVHVDIFCASGYHVSDVTLTPSSAGIVPTFGPGATGAIGGVDFVMPAGGATVTVTYEPDDPENPPIHKVTLHTDAAGQPTPGNTAEIRDNNVALTQPNMANVDGDYINAYAWDTVTINVTTSSDRIALVYALQPGGANIPLTPVGGTVPANTTTVKQYTFIAPSSDADVYVMFVDATDVGDYIATLTVIDDDAQPSTVNGAAGNATLTRSGSGSATTGIVLSKAMPGNTSAITANAGDDMELTVAPSPGHSVSVAYVTPSGAATLIWSGNTAASFIMPNEDVGVVVRFHQGDAPLYTVDLMVSGPAGAGTASLGTSSTSGIYSQQHYAGDGVDFAITVNPGYYIQSVTVTPAPLGITPYLSGTFGSQTGSFTMPAASVYVNVVFAEGYPDTAEYDATLKVIDPNGTAGGTAQLENTDPARLSSTAVLSGGQQDSVKARTGDVMEVEILANPGYVPTITITDNAGNPVGYQWVDATHIRFDMAGGPTLVVVRFDKGDPKEYKVTLHVDGFGGDNATITDGSNSATATAPAPVGTDSDSMMSTVGSTIQVTANSMNNGFIQSVIVMQGAKMISITPVAYYNYLTYTGEFAVPEGDVDVYVTFGDTAGPTEMEFPVVLTTVATDGSAPAVAGYAEATGTSSSGPATGTAQSNDVSVQINATVGSTVRIQGYPATGYVVSAIRLAPEGSGLSILVPFTWIDGNTVEFEMPSQPVGIEVELKKSDEIPTNLKAQVVVNGAGSSSNKGIIYEDGSAAVAGQTLIYTTNGTKINVDITVAPGYEIEYVQLQSNIFGVGNLSLTAAPDQSQTIQFTMLPDDVVVYVKMKKVAPTTFTATLEIVDTSSAFINTAKMESGATTVNGHGAQITGLADGDTVKTTALPAATAFANGEVRIVGVLATDKNGTTTLTGNAAHEYGYTIDKSDVTITVIYADASDDDTYIAKVVKDDPTGNDNNIAAIHNTTNTALPHGDTWTEAWPDHALRVDVTATNGYFAVVTATRDDNSASVPVAQFGFAGKVTAYLNMPGVPSSDVTVTVKFVTDPPAITPNQVKIDLVDASGISGNDATLTEMSSPTNTNTDTSAAAGDGVALPNLVMAGSTLNVKGNVQPGAYVSSATITANGVTVPITIVGGSGSVAMPAIDTTIGDPAVVTVYVEAGEQSGRPYDPNHNPNSKGYIPGYLEAQNLGGGRAHIQVPYLYDGATHDATSDVTYKLYIRTGSGYEWLDPDLDYEVTEGYDEYATIPGSTGTGIGTEFTIRAREGNTSLSDWLINGGVIYITATEAGKAESEFVEVELPADPDRGEHKATLRIVDFSHITGNGASMSDGYRVVNVDGGILDKLLGGELIKTDVTVAPGATLVNVTVTDSTGTRPLSPDASGRYPYNMTGEDIVITVFFDDEGTKDDPELYIATVQKAGLHGVAGNGADIHNATRNDLPRGVIWAAGYAGNDMSVDVSTAPGYYAVVTAYGETTGTKLPVVQLGAGSATLSTTFQAFVSIPNYAPATPDGEDVRVVVTYTKDPPPGYESQLTLTTVGTDGPTTVTGNSATLTPAGMTGLTRNEDGSWLVPEGTAMPATATVLVTAGTTLDLTTTCDNTGDQYYVDSVVVTVATTPTGSMTITLDASGAAAFPMPLGATDVKVTWKHDPHTPRPYDPQHATAIPTPATQPGWILAEHTLKSNGETTDNGLRITVPLLHDDNTTVYENAINTTDPDDIVFKLYVKDAYGVYHELTTTDISRTSVTLNPLATNPDGGLTSYNSATFELTSLLPASTLHYYIKHGGVIYITATDTATPRSESKYTEVVVPANYTATLHVSQGTVTGNIAKLTENGGGRSVTAPPTSRLTGLGGSEVLSTTINNLATGSYLVSVIATTASAGSEHLNLAGGSYDYTMAGEDVDIYVVFQDDNEWPDMYTATVKRINDGGKAGNTASIVNEDVSTVPTGPIWTGAYETNIVRVDVTTEPGCYAIVTAFLSGTTTPVPVAQWATEGTAANPAKTHFTMPAHDVDVIVEYTTDPPDPHNLTLTLQQTGGAAGNSGRLDAPNSTNSVTVLGNSASLVQQPTPNQVSAGTAITVTTTTDTGYAIDKVYMNVTTTGGTVSVDIPLTDGVSLPLATMPLGDAEVVVVYKPGHQTPRPYDPAHAKIYTPTYSHNGAEDKSQTHQDGWILAQPTGKDSFQITVPVLHDLSGAGGADQLHHAGYADPADQPDYTLYWRDSLGFHKLDAADITISNQAIVPNAYTQGTTVYNGYQFDVKVNNPMSFWGGYHLLDYLANGGSIYITATGKETTPVPDVESEKTEVVIPINDRYTATLHIVDVSGLTGNGVKMSETGGTQTPVTVDGGQLTGLLNGAVVNTLITSLNPKARIAGVVATTDSGSVNLVDSGGNSYDHTINNSDVDIYVVIQNEDDPFDMYIAAVYKNDPDNKPGNIANVIVNEDVSTVPSGPVWTGAYETNVVRVDVFTEPNYYAIVTAVKKGTTDPVPVVQWATQSNGTNPAKSQFYMPAHDVDVTVTFTTERPTFGTLDLTIKEANNNPLTVPNSATLSETAVAGNTITVSGDGTSSSLTSQIPSGRVEAGAVLKLETAADTANGYAVKDAKMKITVPVNGGATGTVVTVDIPLTNGESLPLLSMPLGDVEVIVTYEDKSNQTPRPYDPLHSTAFNGGSYQHNTTADKSSTHQEGWLLATPTGTDSFHLVVPTLHNMSGTPAADTLYHAGYADPAQQPSYKLYWRDSIGTFHEFTVGPGPNDDINITNGQYLASGAAGTYGAYDAYEFDVTVINAISLWGGYHLDQYLKNGGSIYITATGTNSTVDPVDIESEKTEVVIPQTFIATLHIADVSGVPGSTVTMSEATSGQSVTADNDKIVALAGNETINTAIVPVSSAVRVVGVVATTESGSVNLSNTGAAGTYSYDYVMQQTNVDIYAVIQSEDDPLDDMYIATVYKKDPANRPGNKAEVIVNEDVSTVPSGPVWTAAYGGNVIRVDVETESGYYAKVTAVKHGTTDPVQIVQWGSTGSFSSQFYMVEHDVDVTVEFTTTPPDNGYLYLTLEQPAGVTLSGNMAKLTATSSVTVHGSDAALSMVPVPAAGVSVQAGLPLDLEAGAAPNYAVKDAIMKITLPGNTSGTPDFTVHIPLTDGKALPKFKMPLADAEVVVTYEAGHQTPRPYDPEHAHVYTNSYDHHTADDLSQTHQDGWILATPTGRDSFTVVVPTLHDMDTGVNPAADRLHNAGDAAAQPTYKLYWRDTVGVFTELTDITVTYQGIVPGTYTQGTTTYDGYQLDVQVNNVYEKWGGYHLAQYIANGGSIYITATGADTLAPDIESEKTEVVFPKNNYTATLHIVDVSALTGNGVTMSEVGGTQPAVTVDGGQLTNLVSGTTVKTVINPLNANAQVAGVVATVNGSSVNLTDSGSQNYDYVMGNADVDIYVVIQNKKDPRYDMYIATVAKDDPDNMPNNTASIVNENVSDVPKGPVWTGAYEENVIRVDVTTETDYYATVTAVKHSNGDSVPVVQWGSTGSFSSQFYMPADDVDVTVTYSKTPPAYGTLKLTIDGDTDNDILNSATLTEASTVTNTVTVTGMDTSLTQLMPTNPVTAGSDLDLTTTANTAANYGVAGAVMKVTLPGNTSGTPDFIKDLPLTDGNALPQFKMPLADAEVVVTYQSGVKQTPRPYDPTHSDAYNSTASGGDYKTADNPDKSQTHQEGWLLAAPIDESSFHLVVPTLHDMSGSPAADTLYDAGYADPAQQPSYKLYWRDGIGVFHELEQGTGKDITVSNLNFVPAGDPGSYGTYNAYEFDVTINPDTANLNDPNYPTLWGGYSLREYLQNGGSIYITATGPDPAGTPADMESEKTEVVIPGIGKYKATLVYLPNGIKATMTAWGNFTTDNNGVLTGANGTEVVKVDTISPGVTPTATDTYKLVGVVATTEQGSVNAIPNAARTEFTYTMEELDVEMRVVFDKVKNPLEPKGPHIVTVYRVDDDGEAQNGAAVTDLDVDIPGYQKGDIWTAAYEGNVVRVDVTTATGYYAVITAVEAGTTNPVNVAQFAVGTTGDCYGLFYMPAGTDVDVTVTYFKDPPPARKLELEVVSAVADAANSATVATTAPILNADGVNTTAGPVTVTPGTPLTLTTGHLSGWSVESAVLKVQASGSTTATVDIPIPLTDGVSLPLPDMPMADAKVVVTFQAQPLMPRPYDPAHAHIYTNSYDHHTAADLSRTHQDGWIQASTYDVGSDTIMITVPTLHDKTGDPAVNTLYHAGYDPAGADAAKQPKYNLYWKDSLGAFHLFSVGTNAGDDVRITDGKYVPAGDPGTYSPYDAYQFKVTVNKDASNPNDPNYPTLWGGYTLREYIENGGSIYITALDPASPAAALESEMTEVVIPASKRYKATLHFETAEGGATMTAWGSTANTNGQVLTGINGTEKVVVKPAPDSNHVTVGVVATTEDGSVNATWNPTLGQYEYDMVNKDVDIFVVFDIEDDPLKNKGPHIVTVFKVDTDGYENNKATVTDLDVEIPVTQKGDIWTAAYEGNVVQVDVGTEPGYYPVITAVKKSDGTAVDVTTFVRGANDYYGKLYMPANTDVNVTVKYVSGPLPSYDLLLTVASGDGLATNKATINMPNGVGLNANGLSPNQAGPVPVAPGTELTLTTGHSPNHSVLSAVMKVGGTTVNIDIPLIDGESLPIPAMPIASAEVIVTFQQKQQLARPYDPIHSDTYNSVASGGDYKTADNPDESETGQEGWILATDIDTTGRSFVVTVPTLHDKGGAFGADQLYHAGYDPAGADAAKQPKYNLYWKDSMGNFQPLSATDITVSDGKYVPGAYTNPADSSVYDGYRFKVTVKADLLNPVDQNYPTLWGGYTVLDYINNGGSLYITAVDQNSAGKAESEKTELVIPGKTKFTATLHFTPNGTAATMSVPAWGTGKVTSVDGDSLTGSDGTAVVTVDTITADSGYKVVGVVATTVSGSVNAIETTTGHYEYTMVNEDVDMQVVFKRDDDPLQEKGPHIVTVYKVGDNGLADNDATVTDLDVTIPSTQRGDIWTAAYVENTVRVDVTTATGYHAVITAVKAGTTDAIDIVSYPDRGLFEMVDADVDVTVTYVKGDAPKKELKLTTVDTDGPAVTGNSATLTPDSMTGVTISDMDDTQSVPAPVAPGTDLTLETTHASTHSVKEAILRVTTANGTTDVDIPLTDGVSLPLVEMPMTDAEVIVTFQDQPLMPRPYDPMHSKPYNGTPGGDYPTAANPDLSQTHQDGWIEAYTYSPASDTVIITVPTLHDKSGSPATDNLYHAGYDPAGANAAQQPSYNLYWRDGLGNFHELEQGAGKDVTVSDGTWLFEYYEDARNGGTKYDGYRFSVKLNPATPLNPHNNSYPTLWGGYTLWQYIQNGGSIYITAVDPAAPAAALESEKTEVVIRAQMPRPFDPMHSETYNSANAAGDYLHNVTTGSNPDLSTEHQEGWIKASTYNVGADAVVITVPALYGEWGTVPPGTLYDAVESYKLYYKDTGGNLKELKVGTDITVSEGTLLPGDCTDPLTGNQYDSYRFKVSVIMSGSPAAPATTEGGILAGYITGGGSIYITAVDATGKRTESLATEVVIDEGGELQPYDPDNVNDQTDPTPYADHWITSENRGDYLIVTVPMINEGGAADNTNAIDVDKEKHTFQFYLVEDSDKPESTWVYQDLADVIELTHPDPDNNTNGDPYENDVYYTDTSVNPDRDYNGARFILTVKTDEELEKWVDDWAQAETDAGTPPSAADVTAKKDGLKDLAAILRAIMDNTGTTNAIETGLDLDDDGVADKKYRLFITHEEDTGTPPPYKSPYVDFEVPQYYSFNGILESYAPKHAATFTLYPLKDGVDIVTTPALADDPTSYETDASLVYKLTQSYGTGLWQQDFSVKSSHLMQKDKSGQVYKLVVEKPGHVTYVWLGLALTPDTLDDPSDDTCLTFTLDPDVSDGMIALIGGDVNQNGSARLDDYAILLDYLDGGLEYSRTKVETDTNYAISTWNPNSLAHAADLDGDGRIGTNDLSIINHERNFAKGVKEYVNAAEKPALLNGAGTGGGGGTFSAYALLGYEVEKALPIWAEELMAEGKTVPDWAMELLQEEKELPAWAIKMIQNGKEVPAWAVTMVQEGQDIPAWATELLRNEKNIPGWAVTMAQEGQAVPAWAAELLRTESAIPAWAIALAQEGEELPEELQALLEAGEALPEELPLPTPELPAETPAEPEEAVNPEEPAEPVESEEPEEPAEAEDPAQSEEPEETEEPAESTEPETPEEPTGSPESEEPEEPGDEGDTEEPEFRSEPVTGDETGDETIEGPTTQPEATDDVAAGSGGLSEETVPDGGETPS